MSKEKGPLVSICAKNLATSGPLFDKEEGRIKTLLHNTGD